MAEDTPLSKKEITSLNKLKVFGSHIQRDPNEIYQQAADKAAISSAKLRRKASGPLGSLGNSYSSAFEGGSGAGNRIPLMYMDPLFDPILMMFPKDNIRELNRRLRHYYIYNPYVRNILDLHCLPAGTNVFTNPGTNTIENIKVGDKVLGADGTYKKVLWSGSNPFDGTMCKIKARYYPEFSCTDNHFIPIKRGVKITEKVAYPSATATTHRWQPEGKQVWIMAKEIKKHDYLIVPKFKVEEKQERIDLAKYIPVNESGISHFSAEKRYIINTYRNLKTNRWIEVNEELAELLGWHVAEGSSTLLNKNGVFSFAFNSIDEKKEIKRVQYLIKKIFNVETTPAKFKDKNCVDLHGSSTLLAKFFSEICGKGAHNKKIPDFILKGPKETLRIFLKAYIQGDGTLGGQHTVLIDTVSKTLAYQLVMAGTKLNTILSLKQWRRKSNQTGKTYSGYILQGTKEKLDQNIFCGSLNYPKRTVKHPSYYFEDPDNFYVQVRGVSSSPFKGEVYDIKTDGTFCLPFIVGNSEFPLSSFNLRCHDKENEKFFNEYTERKNLLELGVMQGRDYWLLGESIMYGNFNAYDMEFESFNQYPPEEVDIHATYVTDKAVYFLKSSEDIKRILTSSKPADKALAKFFMEQNPKFYNKMMKGQAYMLNTDHVIHLARRPNKYTLRGISPLLSIVKDLLYEDKMRVLQYTQIDRQTSPTKHWKLGSAEKGWIPPAKKFKEFENLLKQGVNDSDFTLITHPYVQHDWVSPKDMIKDLVPDYDWAAKRYMVGLFVNDAVLHNELGPYASSAISLKVLMNKYLTYRALVEHGFRDKIFRPMAIARGMYIRKEADLAHKVRTDKGNVLDLPEMFWQKLNLMNNTTLQEYVMRIREKGDIPFDIVADMFDWDVDMVKKKLKAEESTPLDPVYRAAREALAEDPVVRAKILAGQSTDTWLRKKTETIEKDQSVEQKAKEEGMPTEEGMPIEEVPGGAGAGPMPAMPGEEGAPTTAPAIEGEPGNEEGKGPIGEKLPL